MNMCLASKLYNEGRINIPNKLREDAEELGCGELFKKRKIRSCMIVDYTFFQDGLLRVDGALALATPSPTNEAIAGRIDSFIEDTNPNTSACFLEELYNDFLAYERGESVNDWDGFIGCPRQRGYL